MGRWSVVAAGGCAARLKETVAPPSRRGTERCAPLLHPRAAATCKQRQPRCCCRCCRRRLGVVVGSAIDVDRHIGAAASPTPAHSNNTTNKQALAHGARREQVVRQGRAPQRQEDRRDQGRHELAHPRGVRHAQPLVARARLRGHQAPPRRRPLRHPRVVRRDRRRLPAPRARGAAVQDRAEAGARGRRPGAPHALLRGLPAGARPHVRAGAADARQPVRPRAVRKRAQHVHGAACLRRRAGRQRERRAGLGARWLWKGGQESFFASGEAEHRGSKGEQRRRCFCSQPPQRPLD